jgi:pimeloyl-ACP methyl ester carboxylesterase
MDVDAFERRMRRRRRVERALWIAIGLAPLAVTAWCVAKVSRSDARGEVMPLSEEERYAAAALAAQHPEVFGGDVVIDGRVGPALAELAGVSLADAPPCPVPLPARFPIIRDGRMPALASPHVVHFATTRSRRPAAPTHDTHFRAGFVEGRAFLWETSAGRVVCAADVRADSSDRIDYRAMASDFGAAQRAAEEDLARALEREIRASLRGVPR